jgi:hypothetical protein
MLQLGTQYEKLEIISDVESIRNQYRRHMDRYFTEMMENFKKVAGYLLSEADLAKLTREKRPTFIYNLLLPIMMKLGDSFLSNQSKVEAQPRTMGDYQMSRIMTDLLDYSHYTANNLPRELGMAFLFSAIGRVGWVCNEWSYFNDKQGMNWIYNVDPFSIMWDGGFSKRDLRTTPALLVTNWMRPEEMKLKYAYNNPDMAKEIDEKAKMFIGTDSRNKLLSYIQRTFGFEQSYLGNSQGFDSASLQMAKMKGSYDNAFGAFEVIQAHERKSETQYTLYDAMSDKEFDITKIVEGKGSEFNNDKMQMVRMRFNDPIIRTRPIEVIYQYDVCPSFMMCLHDEPYKIQNELFKYTPVFCFDFGVQSSEWKGYVDLLTDAVKAFNLTQNTIQTNLMKNTHGEVWYEEDALIPGREEEFLDNRIGKRVAVAHGAISQNRIQRVDPTPVSPGLLQNHQINQNMIYELGMVGSNVFGRKESANEPSSLFAQRVQQSEKMMSWVLDNVTSQQILIGKNTKDIFRKYLKEGRIIKITGDETDPYWLEFNADSIARITMDAEGNVTGEELLPGTVADSDYDIVLSKAPYGEYAKQQEFEQTMILVNTVGKLDPGYIDPELIVDVSMSRFKDKWKQRIRQREEQKALEMQAQMQVQAEQMDAQKKEQQLSARDKDIQAAKGLQELEMTDQQLNINDMISQAVATGLQ